MIISLIILAVSMSGNGDAMEDPCVLPAWPTGIVASNVTTFAELQDIYLHEVPSALMSEYVLASAETAAGDQKAGGRLGHGEFIANTVYRAQIEHLEAVCGTRLDKLAAATIVEQAYARVIARTNLRDDPKAAEKLLPIGFSSNLTTRIAIVGLSVNCSTSTPALASVLAEASLPCGKLGNAQDER